jgi:hypothetical protein
MIRLLEKDKKIPYDLLLLADETIEAINKYIQQSDIYVFERNNIMRIKMKSILLPVNIDYCSW